MTTYTMKSTHRCVDFNGNIGSFVGYWSSLSSVSLGTDILAAQTFSEALDTVMDAKVYETEVHLILPPATVKASPVDGSLLPRRGMLDFVPGINYRPYALSVPAVAAAIINGNLIAWPDALYSTFLRFNLTAGGSPPWISDRYFNPLESIDFTGRLAFQKMRRVLSRGR